MFDELPRYCSIAIVGAGLAGLQLAHELDRRGVADILVIEAGDRGDLRHVNMAHDSVEALRTWLIPEQDRYFHRSWESDCPPHYLGASGLRRRVGGRSLYWHGVVLPVEFWALRDPVWSSEIVRDLTDTWQGGPSLYARMIDELAEWRGSGMTTYPTDAATTAFGLPVRETPRAVRRSPDRPDRWFAYSPLDMWRDPASGEVVRLPANVRICTGVLAVEVIMSSERAIGLLVSGRDGSWSRIGANAIVLAAGAIESSRLALQALAASNATSESRLSGLADHIVQGILLRLPKQMTGSIDQAMPSWPCFTAFADARSNLFIERHDQPDGSILLDLQLTGEQMPSDANVLTCVRHEPKPWAARIAAGLSAADRAVIAMQQEILRDLWRDVTYTTGLADELRFAPYDEPERTATAVLEQLPFGIPVTWSNQLGTEDHEGCLLPLGKLLTDNHEVNSLRGLFAVGPATIPRMGAANPALTILALAKRAAAKIAALE